MAPLAVLALALDVRLARPALRVLVLAQAIPDAVDRRLLRVRHVTVEALDADRHGRFDRQTGIGSQRLPEIISTSLHGELLAAVDHRQIAERETAAPRLDLRPPDRVLVVETAGMMFVRSISLISTPGLS